VIGFVTVAMSRATNPDTLLMNTALWALSAVGVGLILGLAGQPALCQAAFMLVGAYVYAVVGRPSGLALPTLLGVGAAVASGLALAALLTPVLRARGYVFALATITLDLFVRQAFRTGDWLPGRESGIVDVPPLRLGGHELIDPVDYLRLALVLLALAVVLLHLRYGRGRRHRALQVLAGDQDLLAELGQSPARHKRGLFVLAGGFGALAGALMVASFGFVQPTSFTSRDSFALAVAVVIGGRDRLPGAVLGAVVYQMSAPLLGPDLATYQPVLLGATVVASMHLFPGGLLPRATVVRRLLAVLPARPRVAPAPSPGDGSDESGAGSGLAPLPEVAGAALQLRGVTCDFGVVRAVDHVDLDMRPGTITALVGPNGAGKSTLLAAVAGEHRIEGTIRLDDQALERRATHRRAVLGVSRSHQHVRLIDEMTALDSVVLGVDLAARRGDGAPERARRAEARRHLGRVGADHLADHRIAELTFVERRLVDLAPLLATRPRLALLDEPSAGLDHGERARVVAAVEALHGTGCTILLVEHDIAFVRALAHRVVALVDGRVLADGPADEVFELPAFEAAYLGGSVVR
jgi:branched-chain amino acid transport system permease protein